MAFKRSGVRSPLSPLRASSTKAFVEGAIFLLLSDHHDIGLVRFPHAAVSFEMLLSVGTDWVGVFCGRRCMGVNGRFRFAGLK